MTLSELIESLELIKYEVSGDPETDIVSVYWNGARLLIRREGEDW